LTRPEKSGALPDSKSRELRTTSRLPNQQLFPTKQANTAHFRSAATPRDEIPFFAISFTP
jgi:hypothetical protein